MGALTKAWYNKALWTWILFPLAAFFWFLSSVRRLGYRIGLLPSSKPDAFVIVVGNISVGGNGKTPVVIALAHWFKERNVRVGVLSRGYGGTATSFPHEVSHTDPAALVGDEPKLIANRTGVPVVIDPKRTRGASYLKNEHNCDVIICDDGLQHYALKRDFELVVMDNRGVGNGRLLPMGPLREGQWRLNTIDAILHNVQAEQDIKRDTASVPQYAMKLVGDNCIKVINQDEKISLTAFQERFKSFTAMAGIGSPERFFSFLRQRDLIPQRTVSFADHQKFAKEDIPEGVVLMTEKDAVKLTDFGHEHCWYLPVEAKLPDEFYQQLEKTIPQSILQLRS